MRRVVTGPMSIEKTVHLRVANNEEHTIDKRAVVGAHKEDATKMAFLASLQNESPATASSKLSIRDLTEVQSLNAETTRLLLRLHCAAQPCSSQPCTLTSQLR